MTADTTAEFSEFSSFSDASSAMLRMMRELMGLDLWLVTRVHDEEWIVLHSIGSGPIGDGDVLPLRSTICGEMLEGNGPHVAPDISEIAAYREAPIAHAYTIGSYAGAPLVVDGNVYGVLCGISEAAHADALARKTPYLTTAARTLSTILAQQLRAEALMRRVERAESDSLIDELTGLYNRRGWVKLAALEQARSRRYGNKHTVFFMDIDGLKTVNDEQGHDAGDALIARVAAAIRAVVREHDVAARVGGDEFAILATETTTAETAVIRGRLTQAFLEANVSVSIGFSRTSTIDVDEATREADLAMYRHKARRAGA